MMTGVHFQHFILGLSMVIWCVIHSGMIAVRGTRAAESLLKSRFKYYRLFYNIFAVLTLALVYLLMRSTPAVIYFDWSGGFRIIQVLIIGLALFVLAAGAKHYDGMQFLGIRQLLSRKHHVALSDSGNFHAQGILTVTRHPWYVAAFCLLWARELNSVSLIVNTVFSVYLVIGTVLEERKLVLEFGQAYRTYQKRVSMFFPFKWLVSLIKR